MLEGKFVYCYYLGKLDFFSIRLGEGGLLSWVVYNYSFRKNLGG